MNGLLATVVASRGLQPEPVATDALVHLCSSSPSAAAVMAELLTEVCPGAATDGLVFTGQDVDPATEGRPDLVASDAVGARLIVEAKFDAELTSAQTGGAYVDKLSSTEPAALVFLVPEDRVRSVAALVSDAFAITAWVVDPTAAEGSSVLRAGIADSERVVAVTSWTVLLRRLRAAAVDGNDSPAVNDIDQLAGLVDWRSRTGWTPLVPGDLKVRTGRQMDALVEILRQASVEVSHGKTKNGSGDSGPGRYVTTPNNNVLWLGIWLSQWGRTGVGPIWAQAKATSPKEAFALAEAIEAGGFNVDQTSKKNEVRVPVTLPHGAERNAIVDAVAGQMRRLISVVDSIGVTVVEDDLDG